VHRRGALELAVEVVLGRIDRDAPADFAVEVEPQEVLVFRRDADQRESAVLLFRFRRIIRDYPPSAAGLTSNERSVALALFKSTRRVVLLNK
jgi:hypothetical protein